MGRLGAGKCTFPEKVRNVRFDRKSSSQTSVKSLRGIICQKVKKFLNFQKTKKLQKVTFAFLHTCTRKSGVLGGPNRKSASWATFCTLARPNRPSRTFSYVYDVFARSGSSKITFRTFGAKKLVRSPIGRPWVQSTNRPEGLLTVRKGGGFHSSPLRLSSKYKNSTTANLASKVLLWCQKRYPWTDHCVEDHSHSCGMSTPPHTRAQFYQHGTPKIHLAKNKKPKLETAIFELVPISPD